MNGMLWCQKSSRRPLGNHHHVLYWVHSKTSSFYLLISSWFPLLFSVSRRCTHLICLSTDITLHPCFPTGSQWPHIPVFIWSCFSPNASPMCPICSRPDPGLCVQTELRCCSLSPSRHTSSTTANSICSLPLQDHLPTFWNVLFLLTSCHFLTESFLYSRTFQALF